MVDAGDDDNDNGDNGSDDDDDDNGDDEGTMVRMTAQISGASSQAGPWGPENLLDRFWTNKQQQQQQHPNNNNKDHVYPPTWFPSPGSIGISASPFPPDF